MPLYEYECTAGHRFELIRKFSDPPLEVCPTCGSAVQKLFSSPAIQFKGSGWYITDYAKKDSTAAGKTNDSKESGQTKEAGGEAAATSKPSESSSTDSASTPAAKPAAPAKSDST